MKFNKILVSKASFESDDPHALINSNVMVVNLLREEGVSNENLHEDALTSYYVDYYLAQCSNGNFAQFVWNTGWDSELNSVIKKGLKQIGAEKHLALFIAQSEKVESLSEKELDSFFERDYFGPNPTRDKLKNRDFFTLEENIAELNARWLRNHPQLCVLAIEEMFTEVEKFIGRPIEKES